MSRPHVIDQLDDNQFDFVIRKILDGYTDREICAAFETEFGVAIAKSSLNRWRKKSGDELADRYRLKRYQTRTFVQQLKAEGIDVGEDKYKAIIDGLEDHLLTSERELIAQNPVKLLFARQEEERLKLKREELALKLRQHDFEREKFERTQNLSADQFKIASDTWTYILSYFLQNEPKLADLLTNHSETLLNGLGEHIEKNQTS